MKNRKQKLRNGLSRVRDESGNVFADLGLPNPEQELLKARLTLQIYSILKESGMKQTEMAKVLRIKQGLPYRESKEKLKHRDHRGRSTEKPETQVLEIEPGAPSVS